MVRERNGIGESQIRHVPTPENPHPFSSFATLLQPKPSAMSVVSFKRVSLSSLLRVPNTVNLSRVAFPPSYALLHA